MDDSISLDLNEIENQCDKQSDSFTISSIGIKKNKNREKDDALVIKILDYLNDEEKTDKDFLKQLINLEKKIDKIIEENKLKNI